MFACSVLGKAGTEGSVKCWILRVASYFLTFASQGMAVSVMPGGATLTRPTNYVGNVGWRYAYPAYELCR